MSKQGFGTLADLAKIIEEASDPDSELREDRRETKPKVQQKAVPSDRRLKKAIDPKRKAWHDRRLKEQTGLPSAHIQTAAPPPITVAESVSLSAAAGASSGLLGALAAAKEAKPKDGPKRPEGWKRKPGDPFF